MHTKSIWALSAAWISLCGCYSQVAGAQDPYPQIAIQAPATEILPSPTIAIPPHAAASATGSVVIRTPISTKKHRATMPTRTAQGRIPSMDEQYAKKLAEGMEITRARPLAKAP